ncbi:hypothetical protein L6E12_05405 [Actinokineospora sp. PR83]|uniref:hypothetical protein n=1 Tax=Actinokineospora sp. PR83 TaxID=2884908 RepID=UPI001F1CC08D|nr:hypothetical protein [Actinokineospora sp. PR83]MCG8915226.1 hypothetical protein [Actinokineospora sp. PR83]
MAVRTKRIKLGDQVWKVSGTEADSVEAAVEAAMTEGRVIKLTLLNGDDTPATVIFNGKAALLAVIDDGAVPRPTEISGSME